MWMPTWMKICRSKLKTEAGGSWEKSVHNCHYIRHYIREDSLVTLERVDWRWVICGLSAFRIQIRTVNHRTVPFGYKLKSCAQLRTSESSNPSEPQMQHVLTHVSTVEACYVLMFLIHTFTLLALCLHYYIHNDPGWKRELEKGKSPLHFMR